MRKKGTLTGAAIGSLWGLLGGPPGILVGAVAGGVIGHFWGKTITVGLKKMIDDAE